MIDVDDISEENWQRVKVSEIGRPIYYIGSQWAVTGDGVEELQQDAGRPAYYFIRKEDLDFPDWEDHMSKKIWVDIFDFRAALFIARKLLKRGQDAGKIS